MHILIICHEFPPVGGGVATAGQRMAAVFARRGARVTVLTTAYGNLPLRETCEGCDILRLLPRRRRAGTSNLMEFAAFMLASLWWVLRRGGALKADVCLAMMGMPGGPAAWLLRRLHALPYVVYFAGGDVPGHQPEQMAAMHTLTAPFIRRIWKDAAAVVSNSEGLADLARAHAPWVQVSVIRNGVDSALFAPPEQPHDGLTPQLLYTGRLNGGKNVDMVLAALSGLSRLPWHLHVAGDGPLRPALEASLAALGLEGRVTFHGWMARKDMPNLYRRADIFVFPSSGEGTSNSLLEAMACGLPIVTNAVRGCVELVEDGINGYALPEGDSPVLASALRKLMEDPALRHVMGMENRARIVSAFSWERCADAFLEVFQSISSPKEEKA